MPRWLWALLLGLFAALWWAGRGGSAPPTAATSSIGGGAIVCPPAPAFSESDEPRQSEVAGRMAPFRLGDATVSPLAGFSLQARVLSRQDYSFGRESRYSPTDLALGWGPMAEPGIAQKLHISQGSRWYRYEWGSEGPPMAPDQIVSHSSNMHMVPADPGVARMLARIREGDTVRVNGWLVRIDGDDGGHWQSSLSRDDRGAGACELVFVCAIESR